MLQLEGILRIQEPAHATNQPFKSIEIEIFTTAE
jgi:hypothetical protein